MQPGWAWNNVQRIQNVYYFVDAFVVICKYMYTRHAISRYVLETGGRCKAILGTDESLLNHYMYVSAYVYVCMYVCIV